MESMKRKSPEHSNSAKKNRAEGSYLESQLIHVPGLGQRPSELKHVPHAVPGQERRAGEELLDLRLVQTQRAVHLRKNDHGSNPGGRWETPHQFESRIYQTPIHETVIHQ